MPLIDDDGNLFGVVNVIDALAVVLLVAVLVAGVAFVGVLGTDGEPETRYATVDLGPQPDYVVDRIAAGDTTTVDGSGHATVTDVYVTPPPGDGENGTQPRVTVRVAVNGELVDDARDGSVFEFAGTRLRSGSTLEFETEEYVTDGEVTSLDHDRDSLQIAETAVLLDATVSGTTAGEIEPGDAVRIGSHTVATVTDLQLYPNGTDERRALVGVELVTLERATTPTFGGTSVSIDSELELHPADYDLTGDVVRRGATVEAGETTTTVAEIELRNVRPSVANELESGMTETVRGETLATVTSVEQTPAELVTESEDGGIHLREHPTNEDVTLTVELRTQDTQSGLRFHGESLRVGNSVVLDLDTTYLEGNVTRIE
ncbi:DUF4330 family protein [Natronorubrum halophilum]|uniref:DUF4330 family protein n=1 Tax=Natronorubrum halophilum TaxID=1702106 RepID=UPI0010C18119|nr:DUF4330 family protein [Natronorubrum halophilum]